MPSNGLPPLRSHPRRNRAALLGWLGSLASEANDTAAEVCRRHGFAPEDYPPFVQTNRLLPLLFGAVSSCTRDTDLTVREAAIAACIPLVDDARLRQHCKELTPLVREGGAPTPTASPPPAPAPNNKQPVDLHPRGLSRFGALSPTPLVRVLFSRRENPTGLGHRRPGSLQVASRRHT